MPVDRDDAEVGEIVQRFLTERPVRTGWDAASLTVVLPAPASGLAVEALPDPGSVPDDLLARVLADLVGPSENRAAAQELPTGSRCGIVGGIRRRRRGPPGCRVRK